MSITEQEPRTRQERPARRVRIPRKRPALRPLAPALKRAAGLGWPVALALAICLSAFAVDSWADKRSEGSPAANRALLDKAATEKVVADVSAKIARIFTYVYTDPAATERAAKEVLTGDATGEYDKLFGLVKKNAPVMKLSLTTKVAKSGLIKLTDGTAVLLVMLDQTSTRDGKQTGPPVAAQLIVTARNDDGWRISDLRAA